MRKSTILIITISIIILLFLISIYIISKNNTKPPCNSYSSEKCPDSCIVCPPCIVCSSISCQTEEFCKSIGFNRSWHEGIKERLNNLTK